MAPTLNFHMIQEVYVKILKDSVSTSTGTNGNSFSSISTLVLSGKEPFEAFMELFKYGVVVINIDYIEIKSSRCSVTFRNLPVGLWKWLCRHLSTLVIRSNDFPSNLFIELKDRKRFTGIESNYTLVPLECECLIHSEITKIHCTAESLVNIFNLDELAYSNIEFVEVVVDEYGHLKTCLSNFRISCKTFKILDIDVWNAFWQVIAELDTGMISSNVESLEIVFNIEIDFPFLDERVPTLLEKIAKFYPNLKDFKFKMVDFDSDQANPIRNVVPTLTYLNGIVSKIVQQVEARKITCKFDLEYEFSEFVDFAKKEVLQDVENALLEVGFQMTDQYDEMGLHDFRKWEYCKIIDGSKSCKFICVLQQLNPTFNFRNKCYPVL